MIRAAFAFATAALLVGCGGGVERDQSHEQGLCPPSHDFIDGRCQMRQIYVPGGTFVMGRGYCPKAKILETPPSSVECAFADEPHEVTVAPFLVDAALRSQADYDLYDECPSRTLDCAYLLYDPLGAAAGYEGVEGQVYDPSKPSIHDDSCAEFGMRAITEAEWDYIATGGGTRTYPWGEGTPSCDRSYFDATACTPLNEVDGLPRVASYPPTAEGIYDLGIGLPELVAPSPEAYTDGYTAIPAALPGCLPGQQVEDESNYPPTIICYAAASSDIPACEWTMTDPETGQLYCKWLEREVLTVSRGGGFERPAYELQSAYRGSAQHNGAYRCALSAE